MPDETPLNRLNQTGGTNPGPIPDDSAAFQMTSNQWLKEQRHRIRRGEMTTYPSNNTQSSSSPTGYIVHMLCKPQERVKNNSQVLNKENHYCMKHQSGQEIDGFERFSKNIL